MRRVLVVLVCCSAAGCASNTPVHPAADAQTTPPASTPPRSALYAAPWPTWFPQTLSPSEWDELQSAPSVMDDFRVGFPEDLMRKLKPVELYRDQSNLVVVLHRDAQYEWGYYIVSFGSSGLYGASIRSPPSDGKASDHRAWTFRRLRPPNAHFEDPSGWILVSSRSDTRLGPGVYAYSRQR